MMNIKALLFYIVSVCLLCWPGLVQARAYRLPSDKPATEIYPAMLSFAMAGDYTKVSESVASLGAVPAEIKNKFGVDVVSEINAAVESKNRELVVSALCKLVFYDIKNIFATITQSGTKLSPKEMRILLKTAAVDYSLLSPKVKMINLWADQRIRKLFQWAIFMVPTESCSPFTHRGQKEIDQRLMSKLTKLMEQVEQECLKVFPNFGAP